MHMTCLKIYLALKIRFRDVFYDVIIQVIIQVIKDKQT